MKTDFEQDEYFDELPLDEPDWEEPARSDADIKMPRRSKARRRKRRSILPGLLGILLGILLGVGVGFAGRMILSAYMELFDNSGQEYEFDDDFDQEHSGDVESNDQADEAYSLPAYNGDSSGLTIQLHEPSERPELDAVTLYQQDLPSTVSITVYAGTSVSYGSGLILTEDGYILTCAHVIENTASAVVTTSDGTQYKGAQLVGSDIQTDLAVLKINAKGLTPAEFADSDQLVVGETVYAIGDPLGPQFRSSLTDGIISGLNRQVSSNGYSMTLIQTTAAVNSGNSGGPLFNSRGQAIGIVNMKMSSSSFGASIDNMGLAVPSTIVKTIVETLAVNGTVERAVLGISCAAVDETMAQVYGIPKGLWVTSVDENSDCQKQGLLVGDLITQANGVDIQSVGEFKDLIVDKKPGDTVTLTIWRQPETEQDEGDASASTERKLENYHFEYYGEITVALVSSYTVSNN